ncbi:MAG: hypothetical protein LQ337_002638 [Flavoplaca oasis]|nr:MAG: hypothetical protein LQ337_002638 [Flavoplaca oasis]
MRSHIKIQPRVTLDLRVTALTVLLRDIAAPVQHILEFPRNLTLRHVRIPFNKVILDADSEHAEFPVAGIQVHDPILPVERPGLHPLDCLLGVFQRKDAFAFARLAFRVLVSTAVFSQLLVCGDGEGEGGEYRENGDEDRE